MLTLCHHAFCQSEHILNGSNYQMYFFVLSMIDSYVLIFMRAFARLLVASLRARTERP